MQVLVESFRGVKQGLQSSARIFIISVDRVMHPWVDKLNAMNFGIDMVVDDTQGAFPHFKLPCFFTGDGIFVRKSMEEGCGMTTIWV